MFHKIKAKVVERFNALQEHTLFRADVENGVLYQAYLTALPLEERQPHTCNACRHFFNRYGDIVAIVDGKIETLWDFEISGLYSEVPKFLHKLVSSARIASTFNTDFQHLGVDSNNQLVDGRAVTWEHFHLEMPRHLLFRPTLEIKTVNSAISENTSTRNVFKRGMKEIPLEVCQTVLDLIDTNSLYRGAEFREGLVGFMDLKRQYAALSSGTARHLFCWENSRTKGARIRNTALGTLLVDLSKGDDLEAAVKAYETVVAPANFQRTTKLVTPKMIAEAEELIAKNGYSKSLQRRHATIDDVKVTDLLYVNRSTGVQDDVFSALKADAKVDLTKMKRKQVTLSEFLAVATHASSVNLLLEPSHTFVSLIAPEHDDAKLLFKWDNAFSWMYQNNLTDAITEKVKAAGGRIDAELRISLEWFNYDDLDLHVIEPNGNEIAFHCPRSRFSSGFLDVDMNARQATTRTPVENVAFDESSILNGHYKVVVNNYCKRENKDFGFNLQIECRGTKYDLSYAQAVGDGSNVFAANFDYYANTGLTNLDTRLKATQTDREMFGVMTGRWQKVSAIMWSPNYWGENRVGNQHLMVMLENARINEPLRPFSNEYLDPDLYSQRRVFELLSERLKVQPSERQFTGVGFSVTQNKSFIAQVDGVVYQVSATM